MTDIQKRYFTGIVAFILLAGFTWFHLWAMLHPKCTSNSDSKVFLTTLTGIVAAVVAITFNQSLPAAPPQKDGAQNRAERVLGTLKNLVTSGNLWSLETMTTLYVICYFTTGIGALILTLVSGTTEVQELTRNHGLTTSGLILGIGKSFFSLPKSGPPS